jgi:hypothetical protein
LIRNPRRSDSAGVFSWEIRTHEGRHRIDGHIDLSPDFEVDLELD